MCVIFSGKYAVKELCEMEHFKDSVKMVDNNELQMVFTRRKPQRMQIRQAFYLVDSNYVKKFPNEFYIRSLNGQIFLIKYDRFLR